MMSNGSHASSGPSPVYEIAVEQRLQQRRKRRLGRRDDDQGEHRKRKLARVRPDVAEQAQVELQAGGEWSGMAAPGNDEF